MASVLRKAAGQAGWSMLGVTLHPPRGDASVGGSSHRRSGKMRIVVDLNRCQGYAQCVPLAPDVFQLHGEEALMYDPNPDDSQRQRVLRRGVLPGAGHSG